MMRPGSGQIAALLALNPPLTHIRAWLLRRRAPARLTASLWALNQDTTFKLVSTSAACIKVSACTKNVPRLSGPADKLNQCFSCAATEMDAVDEAAP